MIDGWQTSGNNPAFAAIVRLGPMASGDAADRLTVLAECTEALLGGIYLVWGGPHGGLDPVMRWLTPHWRQKGAKVLADPHRQNWKSALQEWRQGLGLPRYSCRETGTAHGDPKRFFCQVDLNNVSLATPIGEG